METVTRWEAQRDQNYEAMLNPAPGDYWHEMFCPYFLVVQVQDNRITVLNCLPGLGPSARKNVDNEHWAFDVSTYMEVDRAWIARQVQYVSSSGFVADVVRGKEKQMTVVNAWIQERGQQLIKELRGLGPEISRQILLKNW